MHLYNTLTKSKEKFVPLEEGKVKIYSCGPTVYNYIHIGNARPMCVFDVLRRYLEKIGFEVDFVQNFTDIDDKIINRANEEGLNYKEVSHKYIEEYKVDARGLNIKKSTYNPKATENIGEILDMISNLVKQGFAYPTQNGDVYFRTKKFSDYGKLSHQSIEDLKIGARIEAGDIKEDPLDFALWKASKQGEPYWESPWGKGRPGWHIECSAMATKYLGKTIDIHCGGQDLIFPHHENEIAQSECCNHVKFANYWLHNGYINVDKKKMSKSLGNFFTVRDVSQIYGYEPIRYLMISSHYRSPINYSQEIMEQCKSALERLYNFRENLEFLIEKESGSNIIVEESEKSIRECIKGYESKFYEAMDDDLNTADALAAIFEIIKHINKQMQNGMDFSKDLLRYALNLFNELTGILGILYNSADEGKTEEIENLITQREEARKNKNWAEADRIRDLLKSKNIVLEDTVSGVKWRKNRN